MTPKQKELATSANKSAYAHSFSVASAIGYDNAAVEFGREQAAEAERLLAAYRGNKTMARRCAKAIEHAIRQTAARDNTCLSCGVSIQHDRWSDHGRCGNCRSWSRRCDWGHRWTSTDAEDRASGSRGPCGHYWV